MSKTSQLNCGIYWQRKNAAASILKKSITKHKHWISKETFDLIEEKVIEKIESADKYKIPKSKVQKDLQKDKKAEIEAQHVKLEENMRKRNNFWNSVKADQFIPT